MGDAVAKRVVRQVPVGPKYEKPAAERTAAGFSAKV
jgi:hypothetical protein